MKISDQDFIARYRKKAIITVALKQKADALHKAKYESTKALLTSELTALAKQIDRIDKHRPEITFPPPRPTKPNTFASSAGRASSTTTASPSPNSAPPSATTPPAT